MAVYQLLAEEDRQSRRTAMDGLEVLRQEAGFGDHDRASVQVGFLRLPSNDKVGLISVRFHDEKKETVSCVSLPASTHFTAIPDDLPVPRRFDIARLDNAEIDATGRIRLADGTGVRALQVESARLPTKPSELDYRIVHLTLELMDAKACYRSLRDEFPAEKRHMIPDLHFLDVALVRELKLQPPPLTDIVAFIVERYKSVSGQQVANALHKFGIRYPEARPTQ